MIIVSRQERPPRHTTQISTPRAALLVLSCCAALVAGCASNSSTNVSTGLLPAEDWPPRITDGLEQIAANTPDVLVHSPATAAKTDDDESIEPGTPAATVKNRAVLGLGIVLEIAEIQPDKTPPPADETELVFVSFSPLTHDPDNPPKAISYDDVVANVHWTLYDAQTENTHGLVVHLGGNKYVRRKLRADGWAVLSSSGTGRYFARRETPEKYEVVVGTDNREVAAQIAKVFDDELADWPYALEAVLDYIAQRRPDIPQKPAVLMGFSIGALGMPAVAARMPDRFAGAVVVAGGANLLQIASLSSKANPGVEFDWTGGEPAAEDWDPLFTAYLEASKLDPAKTAVALVDRPLLMFQAHFDQVVPTKTGDLLWERLGRPKRSEYPAVSYTHLRAHET